ncbi:MAG: glycosyltransferase [Verrucomicrobia bacterium]|nr:glycosyltransferase [Verrucomicrobiota bacterium]
MPAIHQLVAGFSNGDAISNEARLLQTVFREWGHPSEIFSEARRILPELRHVAQDTAALETLVHPDDIVLLHLSIGSIVNDVFERLRCRKVVLYHNITPAHYFQMVNKQTAFELERGRRQVAALAGVPEITLADSQFNANELVELGYPNPRVLPLVLNLDQLKTGHDRSISRKFKDDRATILFVGRCAPNKKIEDLLTAFKLYHQHVNRHSRLIHVGSFAGTEPYYYLQLAQAKELGADAVHFAGAVTQAQLNAYYDAADVFLCLSDHEGFCIPLLEAMVHDVPILAYAAGAVEETLAGAGILIREKRYDWIAETLDRLIRDAVLRAAVITQQRARLAAYRDRNLAAELRQHLAPLLAS